MFGTDGRGAANLIVHTGGSRELRSAQSAMEVEDESGNVRSRDNLFMDGPEIFNFTLSVVPRCVSALLAKAGLTLDDIGLFFFHQANAYMLEHLRKRLRIPTERFPVTMSHCGNTVSLPSIALKQALDDGRIRPGERLMLVGFGVGYSWGATLVRWLSA